MKIHSINEVAIIEVIRVDITVGDVKSDNDPLRQAFQYWSIGKDAELLAEADPHAPRKTL